MSRFCLHLVVSVTFALFSAGLLAAEPHTAHTLRLSEGEEPPVQGVEAVAWLAGYWQGEGFGMHFEEVWGPPSAGTMVGYYKLFNDEGVQLTEHMQLMQVDGRLRLRVKHFSADFTAWEEKAEFVDFKLVRVDANAVHFSGISFYRRDADRMDAYLVMKSGEEIREEHLVYQRMPAPDSPPQQSVEE